MKPLFKVEKQAGCWCVTGSWNSSLAYSSPRRAEADAVRDFLNNWRKPPSCVEAVMRSLVDLVQTMIDNDPSEPIGDAGHTVLDMWRHGARPILADAAVLLARNDHARTALRSDQGGR